MDRNNAELSNLRYEIFILAITIISLFNILLLFIPMTAEMHAVVRFYDAFLCLILLGDFFYRLFKAPSKTTYLLRGFGWSDFLGSLPLPGLRLLRLFHVVYLMRRLDAEGLSQIRGEIRAKRGDSALFSVFFLILFSLEFASITILGVEPEASSGNIRTASDALWWAYVSITTVGYGDLYPVTDTGRLIGVVLLAVGVGLFSVLTGYLAQVFLAPRRARHKRAPSTEPDNPHHRLEEIKTMLQDQQKASLELQEKVKQLEELLRMR